MPGTHGITGQRADAATGLDYYGARYYDPLAGQFTSADTTLAGGLNRYAYVGGNPETRTDPSGHRFMQPRDYNPRLAYSQWLTQPHVYYGSVSDMVASTVQFVLGTDTLSQSFHTLFQDPHATIGDKVRAGGVGLVTIVSDVVTLGSLVVGDPEVGTEVRAADEALLAADAASETASDASRVAAVTTDVTSDATTVAGDAAGDVTSDVTSAAGDACGLSFAADTLVATPSGKRPIASLKVGDPVLAYNPATGQRTTQTIVRVYLNHDHDRLDVTLALPSARAADSSASHPQARDAETARERARLLAMACARHWMRTSLPPR